MWYALVTQHRHKTAADNLQEKLNEAIMVLNKNLQVCAPEIDEEDDH